MGARGLSVAGCVVKRCGGCGKAYRTGTMIYVADGAGGIARKRVGSCCASRAVPVLVGTIEAGRCKCGAPATVCGGCGVDDAKKAARAPMAPAVAKLRGLLIAYGADSAAGPGLELAINVLEGEDFR